MSAFETTGRIEAAPDGEHATLRFSRTFPEPVEAVWQALTDPDALRGWYMSEATLDLRKGGRVDFVSGPSRFHVTGEILSLEPDRLLEYEWKVEPNKDLPRGENAVLTYELKEMREGTLLTLTHRNLTKGTAYGFAPGTHAYLDRLAAHLAGEPLPNWMARYGEVRSKYQM